MIKYTINKDLLIKIAQKSFQELIDRVKAGKAIRRKYATSTAKRRRRYGLTTGNVNLTGSSAYDGKSWRTLDSWAIRVKDNKNVAVVWTKRDASRIYNHQVRRYGNFLKRGK